MTSTTNIHFKKNGQTRYVKHGFSWQLALFGPLAFLMRAQWPLALACAAFLFVGSFVVAAAIILIIDPEMESAITFWSFAIPAALVGQFGNRNSARSYIKNGWLPVDAFPHEWNIPPILPTTAVVGGQATPTQRAHL